MVLLRRAQFICMHVLCRCTHVALGVLKARQAQIMHVTKAVLAPGVVQMRWAQFIYMVLHGSGSVTLGVVS